MAMQSECTAVIFSAISSICFALGEIIYNFEMQQDENPRLFNISNIMTFVFVLLQLFFRQLTLIPAQGEAVYVVAFAILNSASVLTAHVSYWYLSFEEATVIKHFSIILVLVFAFGVLRESTDVLDVVCTFVVMAGIIYTCFPSFNLHFYSTDGSNTAWKSATGLPLALLSSLFCALAAVINRKIKVTKSTILVLYSSFGTILGSSIIEVTLFSTSTSKVDAKTFGFTVIVAISVMFSTQCLSKAYQTGPAISVAVTYPIYIPVTLVLQWITLHQHPFPSNFIGESIIIVGIAAFIAKRVLFDYLKLTAHRCWFKKLEEQTTDSETTSGETSAQYQTFES